MSGATYPFPLRRVRNRGGYLVVGLRRHVRQHKQRLAVGDVGRDDVHRLPRPRLVHGVQRIFRALLEETPHILQSMYTFHLRLRRMHTLGREQEQRRGHKGQQQPPASSQAHRCRGHVMSQHPFPTMAVFRSGLSLALRASSRAGNAVRVRAAAPVSVCAVRAPLAPSCAVRGLQTSAVARASEDPRGNMDSSLPSGFEKLGQAPEALSAINRLIEVLKKHGVDVNSGEKPSMMQLAKLATNSEVREYTGKGTSLVLPSRGRAAKGRH